MRRSSLLADFLRARPPRANPVGAARDAWGLPTPVALQRAFSLPRPVDPRVIESFDEGPPAERWEAMAAAGTIPPGWASSSERFFLRPTKGLYGSAHAVPTNAELVAAMAADPAGVEDAEEFAALVTGHPAYKGPYVPDARPGWRQDRYLAGLRELRSPSLSYHTRLWLQEADYDLTAVERGEAERRAGLAEAIPLGPPTSPDEVTDPRGARLINETYRLAHAWGVRAERAGGPNHCAELLDLWMRGYEFTGVERAATADGRLAAFHVLTVGAVAPA